MNKMTRPMVVNIETDEYDVFIGRLSKWGNPFKIGPDKYTRKESLDKYKLWIVEQNALLNQVSELRGKVLGCYCKPEDCQGDTLLMIANNQERIT